MSSLIIIVNTGIRVFVSKLPNGVTELEIESVVSKYGEIISTHKITKFMYGTRIDTGDRVIIFKRIIVNIPSYVFVRGWRGFVNYSGSYGLIEFVAALDDWQRITPDQRKNQSRIVINLFLLNLKTWKVN